MSVCFSYINARKEGFLIAFLSVLLGEKKAKKVSGRFIDKLSRASLISPTLTDDTYKFGFHQNM